MIPYLENAKIEHFYPMHIVERKMKDTERKRISVQPVLQTLLFVKSSKEILDPIVNELKLRLSLSSNVYYRDLGTKKLITVPEEQMRNFIAVAGSGQEQVIYLSNEEVRLKEGKKVRVIGGAFEGVEGILMRIQGESRVVVSLTNLFSVGTAFIPSRFILPIE